MEERIRVGEENDASDWHDEDVRCEHTILLQQNIPVVSREGQSAAPDGFEPGDCGSEASRMIIARRGLVCFDELKRNIDVLRCLRFCPPREACHQRSAYSSEDSWF